ncbi:methylated-DNA--[protein]-cysteine S-methyltransferase [Ahrensia kielensis]|uniref:methylated-DNA--[protein]-cysteine S-methyltransferase n=1 Tax=Ahrensia kielensis TaxID=76980 RepID=UPI00037D098B|nr:bifunctional helix-turn-helix domain-containing protein/methylated-DNA--[protein]-cysteine S-methyltransferase [Ahrensia kielensis]
MSQLAEISLTQEVKRDSDYEKIARVISLISENYREQPSLDELAKNVSMEPTALQKLFTRWAGLSPKGFLQAVTIDHARRLLAADLPLLDTAYELGLSGPSRLHDLFVTHESMSPGEIKSGGAGLTIHYGFHASPFGLALIMATTRGLAGLAFCDIGDERATFDDMAQRWPFATFEEDLGATQPYAQRVFNPTQWRDNQPLRVVLIGTDFQVDVWEALLKIPMGRALPYSQIAQDIGRPKASRAVGAAVGANPISFVVPCHRAMGKSGALTGYHWGLTRKRAMLGWEAGQVCSSS